MVFKEKIKSILKKSDSFKALNYRKKINNSHKMNEVKNVTNKHGLIYYIIAYDDPQSSGWTVWERVVLYGSIYAEDHKMIPVVDMKNYGSIYQTKEELGKINIWDRYYLQPGGVSLEQALSSNNYIYGDSSPEWFWYERIRKPHKINNNEFLRKKYEKYIKLRPDISLECENNIRRIIPDYNEKIRILTVKIRGTDYLKYSHSVQPKVKEMTKIAKEIFNRFQCDYYYISTEDPELFNEFKQELPNDKIIEFNSGNAKNVNGFVGAHMSKIMGEHKAAMDYLTTLYLINKSCCLVGGLCGATIVAQYRKNPPYEYINIIDTHNHY